MAPPQYAIDGGLLLMNPEVLISIPETSIAWQTCAYLSIIFSRPPENILPAIYVGSDSSSEVSFLRHRTPELVPANIFRSDRPSFPGFAITDLALIANLHKRDLSHSDKSKNNCRISLRQNLFGNLLWSMSWNRNLFRKTCSCFESLTQLEIKIATNVKAVKLFFPRAEFSNPKDGHPGNWYGLEHPAQGDNKHLPFPCGR